MSFPDAGELHIEGIAPEVLHDLIREYPDIRPYCVSSPSPTPSSEHRETALLDLVVKLVPPTLTLIGAVLNFVAVRQKGKTRATVSPPSNTSPPEADKG